MGCMPAPGDHTKVEIDEVREPARAYHIPDMPTSAKKSENNLMCNKNQEWHQHIKCLVQYMLVCLNTHSIYIRSNFRDPLVTKPKESYTGEALFLVCILQLSTRSPLDIQAGMRQSCQTVYSPCNREAHHFGKCQRKT